MHKEGKCIAELRDLFDEVSMAEVALSTVQDGNSMFSFSTRRSWTPPKPQLPTMSKTKNVTTGSTLRLRSATKLKA